MPFKTLLHAFSNCRGGWLAYRSVARRQESFEK
ncbi:MAG: hypothetical protein ACI8W8_000800 [Rhodothermales bacterium]|jgi:hypothetical protein